MTNTKLSKLDRLLEQQRQLANRIATINAREKASERKDDTRRKILIGGAVIASHQHGDFTEKQLVVLLDGYLTYPRDRALFPFLPPRPDDAKEGTADPAPAPSASASGAASSVADPNPAPPVSVAPPKQGGLGHTYRHNPIPRREDLI